MEHAGYDGYPHAELLSGIDEGFEVSIDAGTILLGDLPG